ncbi:hypothetical protein WME73_36280 [Sorangium sp. So ce302]|uniref:hypothetical protein n=1 Tax=Sorangium sp. So ce302 TaxID=3133297 RepID=UPI003F624262
MDARFSILTFPQRFDGRKLHLRILLVPKLSSAWNGDPLLPVITNLPNLGEPPAFADADLRLAAHVIDGLDRFPVNAPVDLTAPLPAASGPAVDARALFEELVAAAPGRFRITTDQPRLAEPVKREIFIRKYLPRSYRESFLFTGPRTQDAVTDDSYRCAVKDQRGPNPAFVSTPDTVSWGQVYAYCLRHHQLARRLGLIREASFVVPDGLLADGGFLHVDLAAGSDFESQAAADYGFLARYAARIPRLKAGTSRPLFAAVQFPVLFDDPTLPGPPAAPGNFDAVFIEAADYDDGFAKIVHGFQPVSQNLLAEDPDGITPLTDIGIRLGWDDEQILIWQNRQLKADPTVPTVGGPAQRLDAPMGVFGYRIDARERGQATWRTLVQVRSKAPLTLGAIPLGQRPDARWTGELGVEVHPQQLDGNQATGQFWLPSYMTQWNGTSLVLPDENAAAIFKTEQAQAPASLGRLYDALGLNAIPLRYGRIYEFRVRLMDPTGGGPRVTDDPIQEAPAPVAKVPFRRHVVPEPVRVLGLPKFPDEDLDTFYRADSLKVRRPLLGYPSVVFTGKYADPIPLLLDASDAAVGKESFGIADPDVRRVQIDVEVRALRMDNQRSLSGREAYALLYTTTRDFPTQLDDPREIPLQFKSAAVLNFGDPNDLGELGFTQAQIDALDELVLPTARDIRLTLRGIADDDPAYFASGAHVGKPIQLRVRRESSDERHLFARGATKAIQGIYLQPDPVIPFDGTLDTLLYQRITGERPEIIERLAQQVGAEHKGLTLVGKKGKRVVFGCSRRIRHTLSPDNSSLTFAAKEDLINHWIVALTLQLDRDWTWDGLQPVSFEILRRKKFASDAFVDDNDGKPVGDWEVIPTASLQALEASERDHTTLLFLDAVEPKSDRSQAANAAEPRFPDVIELEYEIRPRFKSVPAVRPRPERLRIALPVTTPPAQLPRIVSAGLALSTYKRDEKGYTYSEPRRRFLWLELEEPIKDPNDAYFIRLLGYAPDPLLSDQRGETFIAPEEPPLPIDPELIRVFVTEHPTDDKAGLSAMMQLQAAGNSDRHFLVPLPPGLNADSPELFGIFTYELRVGHANIWSTAQGRFGRPLRTTGVQHPAPTLFCTCLRNEDELLVEAPFAEAVLNGKNITQDPPRTQIWALLYAQVRQADGKDSRNILLEDRALYVAPRRIGRPTDAAGRNACTGPFQNRDAPVHGVTVWKQDEIAEVLRELGLPSDAPLSVLCVEMMPTLSAMLPREARGQPLADADLPATVRAELSGTRVDAASAVSDNVDRPLSDALGHHRILRTSPLTPIPEVCCTADRPR